MTKCKENECNKNAYYNLPGQSPVACGEHRTASMINVTLKPCAFPECITLPSYNFKG